MFNVDKKEIAGSAAKGLVVFGAAIVASAVGKVIGAKALELGDSVKSYFTEKTPKEEIDPIFED